MLRVVSRLLLLARFAFARPRPGWEEVVVQYHHRGVTVWSPPTEGGQPLTPWPIDWLLAEGAPLDESPVGLRWLKGVRCAVTDVPIGGNIGVRCARCGRPLHQKQAGMRHTLNVPACPGVCRWRVNAVLR